MSCTWPQILMETKSKKVFRKVNLEIYNEERRKIRIIRNMIN